MHIDSINALLNLTRMIERPHDALPGQLGLHLAIPRLGFRQRSGIPSPWLKVSYSAKANFQYHHLKLCDHWKPSYASLKFRITHPP